MISKYLSSPTNFILLIILITTITKAITAEEIIKTNIGDMTYQANPTLKSEVEVKNCFTKAFKKATTNHITSTF